MSTLISTAYLDLASEVIIWLMLEVYIFLSIMFLIILEDKMYTKITLKFADRDNDFLDK